MAALYCRWLHLEQRSFKMSPQQYMDKLDGVASLVNALGQTNKVGHLPVSIQLHCMIMRNASMRNASSR